MSLVNFVNLAERLLNEHSAQGQDAQTLQKTPTPQASQESQRVAEDQFTPSTQNNQVADTAQAAGLFKAAQISFFSAAADFLLGQNTASQSNQNDAVNPAVSANTPPPTSNGAANISPLVASATTASIFPASVTPTTSGASSSPSQKQLQALNQALTALGLSPQSIRQIDKLASVINNFDPAAFTELAYQLEQLAQLTGQQALQPTPTALGGTAQPGATNSPASPTTSATAEAASNVQKFQVQELVIKFSGLEANGTTADSGNANGASPAAATSPATNVQASAFNLQIEEVNLTLANGNGGTSQIQLPLQSKGIAATRSS